MRVASQTLKSQRRGRLRSRPGRGRHKTGGVMTRGNAGATKFLAWVLGIAALTLVAGPVTAADTKGDASNAELSQRIDKLEQEVQETKESSWPHLGGHLGFVVPSFTVGEGEPQTEGDNFSLGFPMGITVKKDGPWAFDLEFVPAIIDRNQTTANVTIHPGVLYDLGDGWTAGLRMAFQVPDNAWGFTRLINKKICDLTEHSHLFVEMPLPIRINSDGATFTVAAHFGIGF